MELAYSLLQWVCWLPRRDLQCVARMRQAIITRFTDKMSAARFCWVWSSSSLAISSGQLRREADAEAVARNLVVTFLGSLVLWVHEAIGNEELRIQVLYAFSLALLGVCTEESRAELLNANQRFEQQLSREFFQNRGTTTKRSRLIRAAKPDRIVIGVDQ